MPGTGRSLHSSCCTSNSGPVRVYTVRVAFIYALSDSHVNVFVFLPTMPCSSLTLTFFGGRVCFFRYTSSYSIDSWLYFFLGKSSMQTYAWVRQLLHAKTAYHAQGLNVHAKTSRHAQGLGAQKRVSARYGCAWQSIILIPLELGTVFLLPLFSRRRYE